MDPIDGTKGFLEGGPYAIALALIVDGEVKLGVLGCPNLPQNLDDPRAQHGCLFVAEREKGAWMLSLDGEYSERIHVSQILDYYAERKIKRFAVELSPLAIPNEIVNWLEQRGFHESEGAAKMWRDGLPIQNENTKMICQMKKICLLKRIEFK